MITPTTSGLQRIKKGNSSGNNTSPDTRVVAMYSKGPFTLGVISAGYRAARYFTAGCCVYIRRYSGGK